MRVSYLVRFLAVLALCSGVGSAQQEAANRYSAVVAAPFTLKAGVDMPKNFRESLQQDLTRHLSKLPLGTPPPAGDDGSGRKRLTLTGEVVAFKKGNRGLRYGLAPISFFGPGKTKVTASFRLVDPDGKVLVEGEQSGAVAMGVLGGSSEGATNGLAKKIAKQIRKNLF